MALHDGNGWVQCTCGARHWGRHGAAGLLLARRSPVRAPAWEVLLQLRAAWTHEGGTWGVPGGARDSHEDDVTAALREADEEAGIDPRTVTVVGSLPGVDHGVWHYTYVLALYQGHRGPHPGLPVTAAGRPPESEDLRWVLLDAVATYPLHTGFAAAWPRLTGLLAAGLGSPAAGQQQA